MNARSYAAALDERITRSRDRWAGRPTRVRYRPAPHTEPRPTVRGGLVVVAAEPATLRNWAVEIGRVGWFWYHGEDCAEP
ncbi:hypothetical protein [Marinactinospora rubrisoli]|uniref:Uncharacterized protein n=1 Tax=Marinactinospora rubrisoli TaxID=2715399 RepID=A0ABW2KHW3_9ACTN